MCNEQEARKWSPGTDLLMSETGGFLSPDYQDPNDDVDNPLAVPNGALTNPQTLKGVIGWLGAGHD